MPYEIRFEMFKFKGNYCYMFENLKTDRPTLSWSGQS